MDWHKLLSDSIGLIMNGGVAWYFLQEIKGLHRRSDVHDRILSNVLGENFDSLAVSKDGKYPKFKRPQRES